MANSQIKETYGDRMFLAATYGVLVALMLFFLYPLYFVLIASISDPASIYRGEVILLPSDVTLLGYRTIFASEAIWRGYRNTIFYTTFGTLISLAATLPAAYAFSREDFLGRNIFIVYITITMFFSGGLIPTYLVVQKLNMINTIWAPLLTTAVSAFNIIIARTFFKTTIPKELLEAARMDGCSNTVFFFKIVLPLSRALIAIMVLYYGVAQWNSFFKEMIYLRDSSLHPLQLILRGILIANTMPPGGMVADMQAIAEKQKLTDLLKYGLIVVSSIPVLIAYPFLQKYFIKGVLIGSLKG